MLSDEFYGGWMIRNSERAELRREGIKLYFLIILYQNNISPLVEPCEIQLFQNIIFKYRNYKANLLNTFYSYLFYSSLDS